jgi:hypothetical protein
MAIRAAQGSLGSYSVGGNTDDDSGRTFSWAATRRLRRHDNVSRPKKIYDFLSDVIHLDRATVRAIPVDSTTPRA